MKSRWIKIVGLLCLLTCAACSANSTQFVPISGYDSQGVRTGSVLPTPGTLTPY
jgi:uncharacterized lipoprotein